MITTQIQKNSPTLTPVERKVATFVLSCQHRVVDMTVHSVAQECGVASSAVIRFCKSVGLRGFSELKIELAKELGGFRDNGQLPAFEKSDTTEGIISKVFRSGARTLLDTCNMVDALRLDKMASALSKAKRIFIFGVGTSSIVAVDAQYRLSQLGLWATAYTDILFMNVSAVNAGPEDVVLAISHSGRTKAVVDAVRHARAAGAKTIAITSFADSPLYKESHIASAVFADDANYPVEAVSARLAHICFIDALTMSLATKNFDSFADHIEARNRILEEIRY